MFGGERLDNNNNNLGPDGRHTEDLEERGHERRREGGKKGREKERDGERERGGEGRLSHGLFSSHHTQKKQKKQKKKKKKKKKKLCAL